MRKMIVDPGWGWARNAGVVPGVKVNGFLFTCGVVPLTGSGELVGKNDAYAQAKMAFENVEQVLQTGSAGLSDIVKMTIYLKNLADYPAVKRARAEMFPDGYAGVSTLVGATLFDPDILIEIEVVALADDG